MKKLKKVCLFFVLILLLVGMAIMASGKTQSVREMFYNVVYRIEGTGDGLEGKWNLTEETLEDKWNRAENALENLESNMNYDIEDVTIFDENFEIATGEVQKMFATEDISGLDMEVGGCDFTLTESGDGNIYVEAVNAKKIQCYVSDGVLYIKSTVKTTIDTNDVCRIVVQLPSGYILKQVDMEMGAGVMRLGDFVAGEMKLEVGAGQILADMLQAEQLDILVGAGDARIEDLQAGTLDVNVDMGNLQIAEAIVKSAELECSMGNLSLVLAGTEDDYDYIVECGMGKIQIGNQSYDGITKEVVGKGNTGRRIEIECAVGNVDVKFHD